PMGTHPELTRTVADHAKGAVHWRQVVRWNMPADVSARRRLEIAEAGPGLTDPDSSRRVFVWASENWVWSNSFAIGELVTALQLDLRAGKPVQAVISADPQIALRVLQDALVKVAERE